MSDAVLGGPGADAAARLLAASEGRGAGPWVVPGPTAPLVNSAVPGPRCVAGGAPAVRAAPPSAALPTADPSPWPSVSAAPSPPPPVLVTDPDDFRRVLAATVAAPAVGLDTETTGLDPQIDRVRTVQIASPDAAWVVDAWAVGDIAALRAWLAARARAGRRTTAHNAKFDGIYLQDADDQSRPVGAVLMYRDAGCAGGPPLMKPFLQR